MIGNPALVFYGTALYVALSPFVWLFGPDAGMRLAVVVALVVPRSRWPASSWRSVLIGSPRRA